jgi:hypothetical protein
LKKGLYKKKINKKREKKNITCTSYLAQEMWQKPPQKKGIYQNTHERLSIGTLLYFATTSQTKRRGWGVYVEYLLMLFSHIPNFVITY